MNHKTRKLALELYEEWRDEVLTYAPPGISHIGTFDEQRDVFMRDAVRLKKTFDFRTGNWP